jgi:hypothetical protein
MNAMPTPATAMRVPTPRDAGVPGVGADAVIMPPTINNTAATSQNAKPMVSMRGRGGAGCGDGDDGGVGGRVGGGDGGGDGIVGTA